MIYDCFTYAGEKDVLNIRMHELEYLEVTHILVESNKTFTGLTKSWVSFSDNQRLHNVCVTDMPDNCDAWARETHQRNAIMRGLDYFDAKDDDIIIISDVDEIPSRTAVESYKPEMGTACLLMNMYYYWLNCRVSVQEWKPAKILTYAELKKTTPNEVRNGGQQTEIPNGGNHFSWLGDSQYAFNKIQSFSHQEFNVPGLTPESFKYKIENCEDFCTPKKFEVIKIDETYPKYVQDNQSEFQHLIKEL